MYSHFEISGCITQKYDLVDSSNAKPRCPVGCGLRAICQHDFGDFRELAVLHRWTLVWGWSCCSDLHYYPIKTPRGRSIFHLPPHAGMRSVDSASKLHRGHAQRSKLTYAIVDFVHSDSGECFFLAHASWGCGCNHCHIFRTQPCLSE